MSGNNKTLGVGIFADMRSSIQAMISRTCIVSYGIVKEIPADGIVTVEISVADSSKDLEIITCVLANIASDNLTVNIKPTIGDKVLVVFPNKFDPDMFDKAQDEAIFNASASGYDLFSGIAILCNQYKTNDHHNLLDIAESGAVTLSLAYSEDDDKNLLVLTTNADGEVTINSNDKFSTAINKDGELNITSNDTKVDIKKDKSITIDTSKAKVIIDSSGNVTIDAMAGKLSFKNSTTSLYTILNGMLQILNTSLATAGSPASHTVVPQQFAQQSTLLNQLME